MKPEEIIKYLEMVRPTENYSHTFSVSVGNTRHFGPGSQLNKDVSTAIDLAIEAIEKQIPKKPIKDRKQEIRYTSSYSCPSCGGGFIGTGIADYCYHCGQRMDWNVEEFEKEMLEMLEEEE